MSRPPDEAVGTSTPELAVGIASAGQGNGNLAVGNVAGANMINLPLVLGLSAMLLRAPLKLDHGRSAPFL